MLQWTRGCHYHLEKAISFPSDICPEMEFLDHRVFLLLIFWGTLHTIFDSGCANLICNSSIPGFPSLMTSPILVISYCFDDSHSKRYWVIPSVVLTFISLMISDVEHLLMYLLAICVSTLEKRFVQVPWPHIDWIICSFFAVELYELLTYFGYCRYTVCRFLPLCRMPFHRIISIAVKKHFSLMFPLFIFAFVTCAFDVLSKNSLLEPASQSFCPAFLLEFCDFRYFI